ncbi:MAG: NUDIX hydrolase [Yoonia sp.]|uniref:NUDIX hydrolase n=1 Tax=Yoonia sp. TaxID=2212373 RepID=UPI00273F8B5C|nr:NUDIX hydrolase [Yoonia sp.]MDP5084638.1 NUDIX hydrolase [Yoonia sp.]
MQPKLGAIAVVLHEGRFLLVKRKKEPNAGTWGFAGGHVELGETALEAAARELAEETSVIAQPERYLTNIDVITRDAAGAIQYHFLLTVVECVYISGTPVAADDVSDAGWFSAAEAKKLRQSPSVQTILDLFEA